MFFSIASSVAMGSLASFTFLKKYGIMDDAKKIQRIFENSNLLVREDGKKKTIRIYRKRKINDGMEYIYQLPLGMSFKQITEHKHFIEDGLNVKNALAFRFSDLKYIEWNKNPFQQISKMVTHRQNAKKEVDLEFDGMLKVKVYEIPLPNEIHWIDEFLKKNWTVPIGINRKGIITHDFEKLPHLLVAGSTGYGKSNFLKMTIMALIMQKSEHIKFTLIDLKDGTSLMRFKNCKQVSGFASNPKEAAELLHTVQTEMSNKLKDIVSKGFEDVKEANDPFRNFIIIDEAADLADDNVSMEIIKDIARRGRAAGYRLIYCTQYPTTETIPSQVKRNIVSRLCFLIDTDVASRAVLDESGAEELPDLPGRAIYKRVKKEIIQVPFINNKQIKERIAPHINIRPRKDDEGESSTNKKDGTGRGDSLIISETRLS